MSGNKRGRSGDDGEGGDRVTKKALEMADATPAERAVFYYNQLLGAGLPSERTQYLITESAKRAEAVPMDLLLSEHKQYGDRLEEHIISQLKQSPAMVNTLTAQELPLVTAYVAALAVQRVYAEERRNLFAPLVDKLLQDADVDESLVAWKQAGGNLKKFRELEQEGLDVIVEDMKGEGMSNEDAAAVANMYFRRLIERMKDFSNTAQPAAPPPATQVPEALAQERAAEEARLAQATAASSMASLAAAASAAREADTPAPTSTTYTGNATSNLTPQQREDLSFDFTGSMDTSSSKGKKREATGEQPDLRQAKAAAPPASKLPEAQAAAPKAKKGGPTTRSKFYAGSFHKVAKIMTLAEMLQKYGSKLKKGGKHEGNPVPKSIQQSPSWDNLTVEERKEFAQRLGYSYKGSTPHGAPYSKNPHGVAFELDENGRKVFEEPVRYVGSENGYLPPNASYPLAGTTHRGTMQFSADSKKKPQPQEFLVGPRKGGKVYLPSGAVMVNQGTDANGTPFYRYVSPRKQWRSRFYRWEQKPRAGKTPDPHGRSVREARDDQGRPLGYLEWETKRVTPAGHVYATMRPRSIGGIHPSGMDRPGSLPETQLFGSEAARDFEGRTPDGEPNGDGQYIPGPDKQGPLEYHHKRVDAKDDEGNAIPMRRKDGSVIMYRDKEGQLQPKLYQVSQEGKVNVRATLENQQPGNADILPRDTSIEQDVATAAFRRHPAQQYNARGGGPTYSQPQGSAHYVRFGGIRKAYSVMPTHRFKATDRNAGFGSGPLGGGFFGPSKLRAGFRFNPFNRDLPFTKPAAT